MEENVNDVILKVARGESVAMEDLCFVGNIFAKTTTNVVVFASNSQGARWQGHLAEANLISTMLLPDEDWQQNIDRALDFGDIVIIDNGEQMEEIYNALNANDKASRKVIMRDYPLLKEIEPKGITIYRDMKHLRPRALRYATKVSVVLRHAVIPFDASTIPFLYVEDVTSNFLLVKVPLKMRMGYSEKNIYRAIDTPEAFTCMEYTQPHPCSPIRESLQ